MRLIFLLIIIISFPVAWFISEFTTEKKIIRCILGIIALLCCIGMALIISMLMGFKNNIKYGKLSKRLIECVILSEENNDKINTIKELKLLDKDLSPTYESQYNFDSKIDQVLTKIENKYKANESVEITMKPSGDLSKVQEEK